MRIPVLFALALAFTACSPQGSGPPLPEAADFALPDVNPASASYGKNVRLSGLWKERGVVVNFMASWCMPCRMELPALQAIHASGDARIVCVADGEGGRTEDLMALVRSSGLTLPVLYAAPDRASELAKDYVHESIPSTYLIGPDGRVRQLIQGAQPEEEFRRAIAESLSEKAARRR
ncbi:MAG TPA: TlpA disulfide reductase family protein [Candidatus Polarisedimenticolaceae bacterium]|nr:TlpA disulfide reductase family protein [Candidatus Polarisedimenticolaceae bacterium]